MKAELEAEDIELIAEAVAKKLKATAAAPAPKADKPAGKPAKPEKPAEKAKEEGPKVDRAAVLEKVKELGETKSRDEAKSLISKYAESFGKVADSDLPALLADIEAALAGDESGEGDSY
jgi:hypothetical protein